MNEVAQPKINIIFDDANYSSQEFRNQIRQVPTEAYLSENAVKNKDGVAR